MKIFGVLIVIKKKVGRQLDLLSKLLNLYNFI